MSESHIVQMPKGFIVLRILQLVFALITVGLTGFLISNTNGFTFSATAFGIFCGIITLLIVTYSIVAELAVKAAYNKWAILALDAVLAIFWLSAMGSLAALRASFNIPVIITKRYIVAGHVYLAILAVSAAVAAIEFVLFVVSLVLFSIRVHRHRQTAGQSEKIELGQPQQQQSQPEYQPPQQQHQQLQQQYQQPQQQYQQPQQQYQPPQQQYQQPAQNSFAPVSPVQPAASPAPHQYPTPTQSPAPYPQYAQPTPQYPVTAPPQGYAEAPGGK